jgi:hypothetical protein
MEKVNESPGFFARRDWRIWLGISITVIWLGSVVLYALRVSETAPGQNLSLDALGSFLEGVFAPLAFLWLVIGLFIQQRELANNSAALHKTSEQSEKQTQAIAATEMNARQETFFKIAENVKHQIGGISGMLLASGLGPLGSGRYDWDQVQGYFSSAGNGDCEIFARMFLSTEFEDEGGMKELLYGTEIRKQHSQNFISAFERLCRLAANCDVDGIIQDSLLQSAFGLLYLRMLEHRPETAAS